MYKEQKVSEFDAQMMRKCLQLAQGAAGKTSPNPLVGSVIVKDGKIIGEGFHPGVGQPHAEVFALRDAGEQAQGATVYVNLEPCNHYGRTPPCSDALIKAKVAKVVTGMVDPDPRVSGGGIKKLRDAGIEVIVSIEEAACRQLNEAFIHRIQHQQPFGILKYAMTLDGKIASTTGHSAWVTGTAARHLVHQVRSTCDAVIIGGNTVRKDNPNLTTHGVSAHQPLRVIMSRSLDLPRECNLWQTDIAPTTIFTEFDSNSTLKKELINKGVVIITVAALSPKMVMEYLYQQELSKVLWECGGTLAAQAIADGSIQKVIAFVAPKIIGGITAPSPVGDLGLTAMTDALQLKQMTTQVIDSDIVIEGYL
ncbi:bifunctional diaminohydroxyphosphoribosylaminopyrimidine deaminase/5-amino-6-(5-phosphoribosylamino)uracil reductase RibD [Pleurocapsa sp. PCC 7319]|uniref:bifunctional diaminohydroxyphosphoribosylaminopyrimidine deaminase/5-amino-6-(5-phosphoribosylamino)uracil reductase RibD n=1 Tax=Pleurocapsa sp. PCC 7319 TaxID=118161 RepID=UPI00034AAF24|nr:bifunctional diaminohydroxyphosphoribosylaminopyrimidine deaminase/5-amino-6-(5-phosphoribosylamino)uracil reductase RibD [Pleurocapsa sp. PCC 7319]